MVLKGLVTVRPVFCIELIVTRTHVRLSICTGLSPRASEYCSRAKERLRARASLCPRSPSTSCATAAVFRQQHEELTNLYPGTHSTKNNTHWLTHAVYVRVEEVKTSPAMVDRVSRESFYRFLRQLWLTHAACETRDEQAHLVKPLLIRVELTCTNPFDPMVDAHAVVRTRRAGASPTID